MGPQAEKAHMLPFARTVVHTTPTVEAKADFCLALRVTKVKLAIVRPQFASAWEAVALISCCVAFARLLFQVLLDLLWRNVGVSPPPLVEASREHEERDVPV